MKRWFICIVALITLTGRAGAQEVRAFVDRIQATAGETIQLTVSVEASKADVDISPIADFKIVSRSSGTSIQSVNGRTRMEVIYHYTLLSLKTGRLKIPELPVSANGKTVYTDEIIVEVTRQPAADNNQRDILVSARVTEPSPYVGQQIAYVFKLSHAVQISNARFQPPKFEGFTAAEIEDHKSYRSIVSGREYLITEVTYILVPLSAGEKTIDTALLQCDIVRAKTGRRDPFGSIFDDPFFGRTPVDTKVFSTDPITVTVRPLPIYEGSTPFSGLVGRFDVRSEIENPRLKAGDSTTLSVAIEGQGNIMDAEAPEIAIPEGFKTYTDTPQEEISLGTEGYAGKKVFRTALVPVSAGKFVLPAVSITYFDAAQGQYRTRETQPIHLSVAPSASDETLSVFTPPNKEIGSLKKKVEFTGRDILPLKEGLDAVVSMHPLSPTRFLLWLLAPAALFGLTRVGMRLLRKKEDPVSVMMQKSIKALKTAGKSSVPPEIFLSSLYKALTAAILSKSGMTGESLTYAEAEQILISGGFDSQLAADAARLLETIESANYSGMPLNAVERENLLRETRKFIRRLSK